VTCNDPQVPATIKANLREQLMAASANITMDFKQGIE